MTAIPYTPPPPPIYSIERKFNSGDMNCAGFVDYKDFRLLEQHKKELFERFTPGHGSSSSSSSASASAAAAAAASTSSSVVYVEESDDEMPPLLSN